MILSDQLSEKGVSPVVGVILVVAITVVLSTTIGVFVFDLGESVDEESSEVGISVKDTGNGFEAQVVTGEADRIEVLQNGTVVASADNVEPGTSISIPPASPGTTLSFVTNSSSGERTLVTSKTVRTQSDTAISFDASDIEFCQDGSCA